MSDTVFEERDSALRPAFEVMETADAYVLSADVPRFKNVAVTMIGNRLSVSGKCEEESEEGFDRYHGYLRNCTSFARVFTLPEVTEVDKLRASLDRDVLTITVPKKPEGATRSGIRERPAGGIGNGSGEMAPAHDCGIHSSACA
jgi:HSP20 family molecular chaperone IbpA